MEKIVLEGGTPLQGTICASGAKNAALPVLIASLLGPITGGRGQVIQVDAGWVEPALWREDRLVLDVIMRHACGRAHLDRIADDLWRLRFEAFEAPASIV